MSLFTGLGDLKDVLGTGQPRKPREPTCQAWSADDGCIGDSNSIRCDLAPDHNGMHWDKSVKVFWYPSPVAP